MNAMKNWRMKRTMTRSEIDIYLVEIEEVEDDDPVMFVYLYLIYAMFH